jgi:transcription initiation factor TFIIB
LSERRSSALLHVTDRCPHCGRRNLVEDSNSGELTCSSCGYVVTERSVDPGQEWRSFSEDRSKDNSRVGAPMSITSRDMGLSTVIGRYNKDASGRTLSTPMRGTIDRLRKWDRRAPAFGPSERNLAQAMAELSKLSEKLSVSDGVKEKAAYIYRKALERGLLRGRSIVGIVAASLYAAFRASETPRTLKDLAAVSNLTRNDIARDYRILVKEMDLSMPVADSTRSVSRIASQVGMTERSVRKAIEIIHLTEAKEISAGKAPMGLAASALYFAGLIEGEGKTQKEIAEAAGVTEVTVRNRYKGLRAELGAALGMPESEPAAA